MGGRGKPERCSIDRIKRLRERSGDRTAQQRSNT
jgi:hypothetical protein